MTMILRLLVIVLVCYTVIAAFFYFFQDRLLYFPSRTLDFTPSAVGLDFSAQVLNIHTYSDSIVT